MKGESVMLEAGQPGELPLMRQLSALKKTKGLRDPSTTTSSSHKSPILEAVAVPDDANSSWEEHADEGTRPKKDHGLPLGVSGSSRKAEGGERAGRRGLHKSPQLSDADARLSWDLGREGFDTVPIEHPHRESLKNHLEKLGILSEMRGSSGKHSAAGGKSLLHNWRAADYMDDDEGELGESFVAEGFEQEASPDVRNWPPGSRYQVPSMESHPGFFAYRDERGRLKSSNKPSRLGKGTDRLKHDAQILSPLVLNSHDDMQRFSQPQSLFTLEEPYNEEEQYLEEEFESGMGEARRHMPGSRSHSPLIPSEAQRVNRRQSNNLSSRYSPMFTPPSEVISKRTPSLKPVPWEPEFLEYEVDSLEMPVAKEGGRSHHRLKSQKQLKNQQSMGHERAKQPDLMKASRRKGGMVERQSRLQHSASLVSYAAHNPEAEPLPLLTELEDYNGSDEYAGSSVDGDPRRLSMREFQGELGLEAHNASSAHTGRLVKVADKDQLQLAVPECKELALCEQVPRNLSQKYRPRAFEEVVGQNIVTQALNNAILKGKIAPVYLFQGSRGTGKTSAARIFAAALICISAEERRPCGACRECVSVATGKCSEVKEVDAASNNGIERVKALLDETICAPSLSRFKVFIIDECHVLTTETWNALLKILEEPPMNVVFILITTDPDQLPRTAVSRCQKFPFPKIKDSEIVKRLERLATMENLGINTDTLQLIASRSDGSLRDAETTLDQLSLLGQEIDSSTVYELVGSASDERMLGLLDSALLADTVNTVRRARELVDSGVEPLSLMSRLATLITDILAGTYKFTDKQRKGFFRRQTLSEEKLERLRMAMKTLSEAEKQLRVSNDRTTWLTAALLQLGPDRSYMFPASCAGTSVTQSPVALDDGEGVDFERNSSGRQTWEDEANFLPSRGDITGNNRSMIMNQGSHWNTHKHTDTSALKPHGNSPSHGLFLQREAKQGSAQDAGRAHHGEDLPAHSSTNNEQILSPTKLDDIWCKVVEKCQSLSLKQFLHTHGKLVSISMTEVDAVVHLEVDHLEYKTRCERSQKSLANVFELVLGFPVEVKVGLVSLPAEGSVIQSARDEAASRVYSLSSMNHQGEAMSTTGAHQIGVTERFPAIAQTSFDPTSNGQETYHLDVPNWNNIDGGGRHVPHPDMIAMHEEQPQNPRAFHEGRRFSPLSMSGHGERTLDGSTRGQYPSAVHGVQASTKGYMHDLQCDDVYSEGERELDELEILLPQFHGVAMGDEVRSRRASGEAQNVDIDGRRSCDTDLQKSKGSSLKMVRRLTMRSRIRSLPGSDPNSPDNKGSSMRVPRFAMRSHAHLQSNKESQPSADSIESAEQAGESAELSAHKKSKLRGAAGSFARFFQGKTHKASNN